MTLFVKICGLTSDEGIRAAIEAGADAVGFVFAASPREVDVPKALALARAVPRGIRRVAVMRHPDVDHARAVRAGFAPDWLQTDIADLPDLPAGPGRLLPVLRAGEPWPDPLPSRLVFEGPVSGAGQVTDWAEAARLAARTEVLLAGGLNPGNVADAVTRVHPWGVDVSSGVEARRGVKDPARIHEFVAAARAAVREGEHA